MFKFSENYLSNTKAQVPNKYNVGSESWREQADIRMKEISEANFHADMDAGISKLPEQVIKEAMPLYEDFIKQLTNICNKYINGSI